MKSYTRPKEDQNGWNIFFSVFFVLVLIASLWTLSILRGGYPESISLFDVLIIALASFRITRLVVYDKITRFFREFFMHKKSVEKGGIGYVEMTPYTRGIRATLYQLVTCPWCVGMWSALIATFCYFATQWAWYVLLLLAIAGVSTLIQLSANAIGWTAEHRKITVEKEG